MSPDEKQRLADKVFHGIKKAKDRKNYMYRVVNGDRGLSLKVAIALCSADPDNISMDMFAGDSVAKAIGE